jgi:hypothetical protein
MTNVFYSNFESNYKELEVEYVIALRNYWLEGGRHKGNTGNFALYPAEINAVVFQFDCMASNLGIPGVIDLNSARKESQVLSETESCQSS